MTFSQLLTEVRRITKTTAVGYPTAEITESINNAFERVVTLIREAEGRWQWDDTNQTTLPFATTDITSGIGDYSLDATFLEIESVEYLNASSQWVTLVPFDVSDAQCESYSQLVTTSGEPTMYDKVGNSLVLASKPNFSRTGALKVIYKRGPSYFTTADTTKIAGFNPLFHKLLAFWAAFDYAVIHQLPVANQLSNVLIPSMEKQLQNFYSTRNRDEHTRLSVRPYFRRFK